jgi:hypothetical protein
VALLPPHRLRILLSSDPVDPAELARHARAFLEAGRPHQALALLERAPEEALLARLRDDAIADGDAFVLAWVERIGKVPVERGMWALLADSARRAGKEAFARQAEARAR